MAVFDLLKKEHDKYRDMFRKVMEEKEKSRLFDELNRELDIHMEGEEEYVYPETQKAGLDEETLESIEEHHVAKVLQAELEMMSGDEENFMAKVKVFRENVEHHLDEEEQQLFPQARKKISEGKQEQMEDKYRKLKQRQESEEEEEGE
ncbi:MAG: hemerythrin domain-containing protein [Candidatus Omnitrophota bacterium]